MIRTKSGLPKHCCWATDRHGKRRVRFRKNGFSTYLTGTPWSEDFMRQYAAACDGQRAQRESIGTDRTTPGTFNALLKSYYRSPEFRNLKASTQGVRRGILGRFCKEHGNYPVRLLKRDHLKKIIGDKADTPEAANNLLKALRVVLNYAIDIDLIDANPAVGMKRFKRRGDGFHIWTEAEIAQFEARHPIGSKARLALALLLYTAQRRSDVVCMGRQHVKGDRIAVCQQKTGAALMIRIHPTLTKVLAAVPKSNMTFLLTEQGAPFTAAGFGNWFRDRCNEAGLSHCSAHGLRKAAATRLANAGCSAEEIKAVTGIRSLSVLARYTAAADQDRLSEQALKKQLRAEREQNLSNRSTRLDKSASK